MELPFAQGALEEFEAAAKYLEEEREGYGLERLPYSVVVALVSGARTVVAIAHMSRTPGYWRGRVR